MHLQCTLEGSSRLWPDVDPSDDPRTAFTLFADHAGRLKMHNCGCSKGFRVSCRVLSNGGLDEDEGHEGRDKVDGADEGVECASWAHPGGACPGSAPHSPLSP